MEKEEAIKLFKMSEFSIQSMTGGVNLHTTIGKILSTKNHPSKSWKGHSRKITKSHSSMMGGSLERDEIFGKAWEEFFKDKSRPKTNEEDMEQQKEFSRFLKDKYGLDFEFKEDV